MTPRRAGFTMIEMLAVVAILALAATLAGVSLAGAAARASLEDVTARVIAYEAGARLYAARFHRPVVLRFEASMVTQLPSEEDDDAAKREPLRLPGGYRVRVLDAEEENPRVTISADGRTRSYAIEVAGAKGRSQSVVFAGLTGESAIVAAESDAEAILAGLAEPEWLPREDEQEEPNDR